MKIHPNNLMDKNNPQYCLNANLRKATRAVSKLYMDEMKETTLQRTQFTLLSTISAMGQCTITELSNFLLMDQTTVTRSVNTLKQSGYVEIGASEDRRTRVVQLTDLGRETVEVTFPIWQSAQSDLWEKLGEKKAKQLLSLLQEVTEMSQ